MTQELDLTLAQKLACQSHNISELSLTYKDGLKVTSGVLILTPESRQIVWKEALRHVFEQMSPSLPGLLTELVEHKEMSLSLKLLQNEITELVHVLSNTGARSGSGWQKTLESIFPAND
jgi:hypothetical protein